MARRLVAQLGRDDVVFCQSESVGLPLIALLGDRSNRPEVIIFGHNLARGRCQIASRLFHLAPTSRHAGGVLLGPG